MALTHSISHHQNRGLTLVTGPTVEPVSLQNMRTHLRLDSADTSEDEYIADLICDARAEIEHALGIALLQQTWKPTIDNWPGARSEWWEGTRDGAITELHGGSGWLELPKYPLISVDAVTVYDEGSNSTSVTVSSTFDIDTVQEPGRMALKSGQAWPVALRPTNAIEVTFKAGYGTAAADVPVPIQRAVRQLATYLYNKRGDCQMADAMEASGANAVVAKYKIARL